MKFKNVICLLLLLISYNLSAQETSSSLSGKISDEKGSPISKATIIAKLESTGTVSSTITNDKGLYTIPNLRPGGPYTISITFNGFKTEEFKNINLNLGENIPVNAKMSIDNKVMKEVVIFSGKKNNSGLTVGKAQINTLPSLGRGLNDFTRLTPQSNNNSFAGTNFRYNNVTLDGAINNDAIGFSNSFGGTSGGGQSGTAGAGTRTNPYSIETIQEVQVQLAPYDVKLGNFTGGSVNAVTKSGTNDFNGSLYAYGRNQSITGKSVDGSKTKIGSTYHDYQTGFTLGGPVVNNKIFFFVNAEITRRQEPTFYNAGDPGAAITVDQAQTISNNLKTKYGYDPGTYDQYKIFTNSNKLFGKLDFNLNKNSTLMVRGLYTSGYGNNLERSSTNFQFSSTDFTQHTDNINLVAELKTKLGNNLNNQLIASYINVHEYRDFPGVLSPFLDIGSGAIWAGTWREASIYNFKQKTIEFTDNVTLTKGINKFTFGTHNEFYNLTYGFINSWNGRWEYSNINNFLADMPGRIRGAYLLDNTKNNRDELYKEVPNSNYFVTLSSMYAQDEITLSKGFKITPGIRFDYPFLKNQPPLDPALKTTPDYISPDPTYTHTTFKDINNKWLGKVTISPRLGFNFDIKGNQSLIVRGGTGIFTGRMPFAWMGYAYTLTGTELGTIDYKPTGKVPLAINPQTLKDTVTKYGGNGASATREVDIIDNNFKMPSIWRSNIASDIKFGKGYKFTLDVLYTKTLQDVKFEQINIKDSVQYFSTGPIQTPVYVGGKLNSQFSNAYFLTNTTVGYRYNLTAQISKTTNNIKLGNHLFNLNWSAAYTYGMSKDVSNGIRNSFQSNYEVNPSITPSNPQLAYSNFDLRHRIIATIMGGLKWSDQNITSLAFFYSGQSGNPFTYIYSSGGNPFGNSSNANLLYVPKNANDINFSDVKDIGGNVTYSAAQQRIDLNNVIDDDTYLKKRRGKYTERNAAHTPWNHEMDAKLLHEFKFEVNKKEHQLAISFDVFNVLNLINNDWGHITFVSNTNNSTINLLSFANDANGRKPGTPASGYIPTFNFNKSPSSGHYYSVDPISSRWQGQLGVKYSF